MGFTRRVEHFTCAHCSASVRGNGYTNHCPSCLWSKHVDSSPGDRQEACGGMMEPIGVRVRRGRYDIEHRCLVCGKMTFCHQAPDDRFETMLEISRRMIDRL